MIHLFLEFRDVNRIIHYSEFKGDLVDLGGKAAGLIYLKKHRFNVPDFYLITSPISEFLADGALAPHKLIEVWINNYSITKDSLWAVRSSGGSEDGSEKSFAGIYKTVTNVKRDDVAEAVKNVVAGFEQDKELDYTKKSNDARCIIIQKMVQSTYSGVIFTCDPIKRSKKTILINLLPGLGENLVSGRFQALSAKVIKNKIVWLNKDDSFEGSINSDVSIVKNGIQIIEETKLFIPSIIKGAQKLHHLKNYPVDIEIAISDNVLYWLQVRPVTTYTEVEETYIYDNSNIGENYPGLSLPLTISFVKYTYEAAYKSMALYMGMSKQKIKKNEHLFNKMVGGIYGALYYNITAWQKILFQFPFGNKTSKHIPGILGMEKVDFEPSEERKLSIINYLKLCWRIFLAFSRLKKEKKSYLENCDSVLKEYNAGIFNSMSHEELISLYHKLDKRLTTNWLAPVVNGFYAMLFMLLLRKSVRKSRLIEQYPNFVNDILYSQGDIISVKIVRDFQDLIQKIGLNKELHTIIIDQSSDEILKILPIRFPLFNEALNSYITRYGERCDMGELKMETFNYKEDPQRFIKLLKSNISGFTRTSHLKNFDYRNVLGENYHSKPLKRIFLNYIIRNTLGRIRDRENFRFIRTQIFALIRQLFRAMDKDLYNNSLIENLGDSLYLEVSELLDKNRSQDYKRMISERKLEYQQYQKINRSFRYMVQGKSIISVEPGMSSNSNSGIKGVGCCSGIITGKVKIINQQSLKDDDLIGRILVADYIEPGWINIFSKAAGIISEKGNLLSHTAILCREMGITSIVGAKRITQILTDGDTILMDGSSGEIRLIDERN